MFKKDEYLTKEQQIKKSFKKGIAIGTIAVACVAGAYQFIVIPNIIEDQKTTTITQIDRKNQIDVLVLDKDLSQGDIISDDVIKTITFDKNKIPEDILKGREDLKDKVARMNLKANTIITNSMLLKSEDILTTDLRKQDYDHILLNVNLEPGMFIDVRYKKKDGTDFIVAAKKKVIDRQDGTMIINITEKERQYINNATVSAALTEATMYTTIYVDAENQPAAKITYELNEAVKEMINKDPNIVKASQIEIKNRNKKQIIKEEENKENKESKEKADNGKPVFVE